MISKEDFDKIMEFCYNNNTLEFKDSELKLAILDGGWINVIKLQRFLESELLDSP